MVVNALKTTKDCDGSMKRDGWGVKREVKTLGWMTLLKKFTNSK
jgi:hypothetical protein